MASNIAFHCFEDFENYMNTLGVFHINPSLTEIQEVLEKATLTSPPFTVVQVLGTNGKGSTSSMLSALCSSHGLQTGLFTSPHFISLRERILINGTLVSEEDWLISANAIMQQGGETLTYFELLTAMAVHMFTHKGVDVGIIEAGLGGTWDSTTAITADMHIYTPIGLDHMDVLGDSLEKIATDKAGAIRSAAPVVTTEQENQAFEALQKVTNAHQGKFIQADEEIVGLPQDFAVESLPLHGDFQSQNIRLALTAFRTLSTLLKNTPTFTPLTPQSLAQGLQKAWIAGRFQQIPATKTTPPFILDGAHNPHAMAALGLSLARKNIGPAAVIFSCLADKQPQQLIPHLRALATGPVFIPPLHNNSRAMRPQDLAHLIGLQAETAESFEEALAKAIQFREERFPEASGTDAYPILICGSLYLLAEFYNLYPKHTGHLTLV